MKRNGLYNIFILKTISLRCNYTYQVQGFYLSQLQSAAPLIVTPVKVQKK